MNRSHKTIEALFAQALNFKPSERSAFLAGACGDDDELRQRVEELLQAQVEAGDFMPTEPGGAAAIAAPLAEGPGTVIGRYKLLQAIGEGGMGVVYMAEQQEPIKRRVALKIIKLGMDTKQVIARFEAERQALAMMDHPNIAKVFDAGATGASGADGAESQISNLKSQIPQGRPYFVMELVQGVSITEFCDKNHLTARERIALFVPVCQAIQSAHQKGVIHRDIKPSNVLVTLHHGEPMPKVIDFGIAKATNQQLTEKTLFTQYGTMIGTPAYMSPEQAEMSSLDVDTRTDVYSLGVLLYALLTGTTPFPEKRLRSVGYGEMQRIILEEEPEKPSTRMHTMQQEQRTTVAKSCGTEPGALGRSFKGDLDWIVMKCLEKDRRRRYDTPNELVADLKRHLGNEPVSAAAPSLGYQLTKLYQRHRPVFVGATAVLVALLAGLFLASWQAVRATNAEQAARLAEQAERAQSVQARNDRDRAVVAEADAREKALVADDQRQRAATNEANFRLFFYAANMNQAQRGWERNDMGSVQDALEQTKDDPQRGFEWFYWQKQAHLDVRTFRGYLDRVTAVAFSPDGQRLVTGSNNGTPKIWEVASGRELLALMGHAEKVGSLAYSPDGRRIVTGSDDRSARVWDAVTGRELLTLKGHTKEVVSVAYFPDGQRIATGSYDKTARVWDANTGRELLTLSWPDCTIVSLAISPDGQRIVTGGWPTGRDGAKVWDAASGRELLLLEGHKNGSSQVAFSPDGRRILTAGRDGTAQVWDAATGKELFPLPGHAMAVLAAAYSPDGRWMMTAGSDETAKVWDASTGREVGTLRGHTARVECAAFSPDSRRIVTGSFDRTAKLWEGPGGSEFPIVLAHTNGVRSVAISAGGHRIVTAGFGETARVWDAITGRPLLTLQGHTDVVTSVAISPDGQRIVTGSVDRSAKVWDAASGAVLLSLNGHSNMVDSVALSSDGQRIVTGSSDHTAKVWDAATGMELFSLRGHSDPLLFKGGVGISSNGQRIATASERIAKVWDGASGKELRSFAIRNVDIASMALSPDGRRIVTSMWGRTAKVWDAESGEELYPLKGFVGAAWAIAFSPDGRRIITKDRLWDAENGRELLTLKGHTGEIVSATFSPDGRRIVTGSRDQTARVWEAATPEQSAGWLREEKAAAERLAALERERDTAKDPGDLRR